MTLSPIQVGDAAPSRDELIAICVEMMRMRESGDFARLEQFLTQDCEMSIPGLRGLNPFAFSVRGRAQCVQALRSNFTLIELVDLRPQSFVQDDDALVITWTSRMRNRGTGPMVNMQGLSRLRFRGRQVCLYTNYFDTAAVAALLGTPTEPL